MPMIGKIPILDPIWMKIWEINKAAMPEQKRREKFVREEEAILKIRQIKIENKINKIEAPRKPVSSVIAAKIKSVCGSGKNPSWVWEPLPIPFPEIPPDPIAILA